MYYLHLWQQEKNCYLSFDAQHKEIKIISGKIISQFADKLSLNLSDTIKELLKEKTKLIMRHTKNFLKVNICLMLEIVLIQLINQNRC